MTAALLDLDTVAVTLLERANSFLAGKGAKAVVFDSAPPDTPAPYAVQYMLGLGERLPGLSAEAVWPQQVQYSCVGVTPSQARRLGQLLGELIAGEYTGGGYAHAIDLSAAGVATRLRESNRDGHTEVSGVLHMWVETFTVNLARL